MFHVPWFSHTGKIKSQNLFQKATTSFSSPLEQTPHFSRNPNFQSLKRFLKHCSQQREFRFPTQAWTIFLLILRNQTFPSLLPQLNRQSPKKTFQLPGAGWGILGRGGERSCHKFLSFHPHLAQQVSLQGYKPFIPIHSIHSLLCPFLWNKF